MTKDIARCVAFLLFLSANLCAADKNTCIDCHSEMEKPYQVTAAEFAQNIHAQKGLTCTSCHGGDATSDTDAMSPRAGFRGHIDRKQVPELCGACHSDAAKMRQFNPSLRTDQLSQYRTSVHGKNLAKGDTHVAVCTDCHGIHDIRPASDPRSTVHPLNVANTCKRCHADADYMKAYKIPHDQFAGYTASVHYKALTDGGDLSAPTCTTCHGNHGAAPPGLATVENVCATCHVFQAQLFQSSPHESAFASMGSGGCITCHSNHHIKHPTDTMVGTTAAAVCTNCHAPGDAGLKTAQDISGKLSTLEAAINDSREILDRASHSGMEVSDAQLELVQASDALTKARVSVHSASSDVVAQNTSAGMKTASKTHQAGVDAMKAREYRRKGLAVSLLTILIAVGGLSMFIRNMERRSERG